MSHLRINRHLDVYSDIAKSRVLDWMKFKNSLFVYFSKLLVNLIPGYILGPTTVHGGPPNEENLEQAPAPP